MTIRIFLSMLVAGLYLGFASVSSVSALTASQYETAQTKKNKKYIKKRVRRKTAKKRKIRKASKKRKSKKFKKSAKLRVKKRVIGYKKNGKKATRASLSMSSIKNARHAKLTSRGRMSVAKDTRRGTVRNFGKRVSYKYRPGTVVLSNYTRRLYYVVRKGKVISYPIATPRPDEVWSGSTKITKKKLNPDWYPTPAMREKNPNLPEKVLPVAPGPTRLANAPCIWAVRFTGSMAPIAPAQSANQLLVAAIGCAMAISPSLWRKVKPGTPVVVLTRKKI